MLARTRPANRTGATEPTFYLPAVILQSLDASRVEGLGGRLFDHCVDPGSGQ